MSEEFKELELEAKNGDVGAQMALGDHYHFGEKDDEGLMYHLIQFGEMYPDLKPIIQGIYTEITKEK